MQGRELRHEREADAAAGDPRRPLSAPERLEDRRALVDGHAVAAVAVERRAKRARESSALPTTASSVFPTEIASATAIEAPLVALARNAACATPGTMVSRTKIRGRPGFDVVDPSG